jgi:hypothetical protein
LEREKERDWRRKRATRGKQIYSWLRCTGSVPRLGTPKLDTETRGAVTAVIPEPDFKKGTRVGV